MLFLQYEVIVSRNLQMWGLNGIGERIVYRAEAEKPL